MKLIEMNFLPDVYVKCDKCNGKRYNRETLEVKFKGKSINDVLNMTISEAVVFFKDINYIYDRIKSTRRRWSWICSSGSIIYHPFWRRSTKN